MGHKKRVKSPKGIAFVCVVARVVSTLSLSFIICLIFPTMLYSIKVNYFYNLCNTLIDIPFIFIISESLHVLLCLAPLSLSHTRVYCFYISFPTKKKKKTTIVSWA